MHAIKDSLTHRPSSQGWAPSVLLSCHVMCICVCVLYRYILGFGDICWWWFYFSIYLYTYGWYAMNYNFMLYTLLMVTKLNGHRCTKLCSYQQCLVYLSCLY